MKPRQNGAGAAKPEGLPGPSCTSNLGTLEQGKVIFELDPRQHRVPNNCLQGSRESRCYDYWTEDH